MARLSGTIRQLLQCAGVLCAFLFDAARFLRLCLRSSAALAAENLCLRTPRALYQERHIKPRHATNTTRFPLVWLSQWFDGQPALAVVQPETFTRWRRQRVPRFWRWPSCPGRPPIPVALHGLIRQMASDNLTWGQRRIANALRLTLGVRVSPRTVRTSMPERLDRGLGTRVLSQRWRTCVWNHARALIVCGMAVDLFTRGAQAVSARIRRCRHRWWGQSIPRGWQGSAPRDAAALLLLIDTRSVPAVWSPGTVEVSSEDDRSPPDCRLPRHHRPVTAARATPVDPLDLRPAVGAACGWNRASTSSRSAKPLSKRTSQATSLQRAA